ncbi:RNA-binding protein 12 [Pieris rapae]|uniref:RNA-binding protein 12 n=1 Tax=Pieris rapae TaxID=64459 RepID=UPI001E27F0BF|nr:RNA-binding protein 12 [Pieris rapae]
MSVIIRLQNLPWSANALDIRNYFQGLSIPEGGVHIVGGELGDAFIAFSTDEDARQGMMLDGGKIKEIQVKLLLSSRSEMHKVIEAARQSVPILSLATSAPPPIAAHVPPSIPKSVPVSVPTPPIITPFSAALGSNPLASFGIPGLGNPQEIPQPAVIEPPPPLISPSHSQSADDEREKGKDGDKIERKKKDDRRRSRSRSRSRDRDRKDRKRDRRDRSRSRERRRRDRSRSRERRDRKRDRKDRSYSRDRSPRRSRDKRNNDKKISPQSSQERAMNALSDASRSPSHYASKVANIIGMTNPIMNNGLLTNSNQVTRFNDPSMAEALNKLQELGKKRNPNAFQGEQQNGNKFSAVQSGPNQRGGYRREGRRFDSPDSINCCVVIKNAPNHTSYGDVRRFFPYMIDKHGIKMINDNTGRRTGTIYVRFCDPQSKLAALQRKTNELKGAKVVVENLEDDVYDSAVDSFLPYREDNDVEDENKAEMTNKNVTSYNVLKLSDLPHYVKEHDIMKLFSDFSLLSIIMDDCRITRSKIAYAQFVKSEEARAAYERKDTYAFGRRQATITPLTEEEYEDVKHKFDKSNAPSSNKTEMSLPRDPRQRRQENSGPIVPPTPMMMQTQPHGPGFFPNPSFPHNMQAFSAQNGAQFGFPNQGVVDPRTAAANWASRPQFPNQNTSFGTQGPAVVKNTNMPDEAEEEPLDSVLMKGLPRNATDRTIVHFLSDTGAVPSRIHLMLDSNGLPSGDCFCEFRSEQEARQAVSKHGHMLEGCRITVDLVMKSVVEDALEGPKEPKNTQGFMGNGPTFFEAQRGGFGEPHHGFRGRGGYDRGGFRGGFDPSRGGFDRGRGGFDQGRGGFEGRGGFDRGGYRGRGGWNERARGFERGRARGRGRGVFENGPRPTEDEPDPALEDFGAPGCVVSMENVPFRASVDDILAFFSDFELTQDDVIRRYNERGQPTGDARVAFRTPFDAQRAIKTRHMNTIFERRVSLTLM